MAKRPGTAEAEEVEIVDEEVESAEVEAEQEESAEVETNEQEEVAEYPALPIYTETLAGPDEGFDFFGTAHADLKAAGYVTNQQHTKELIAYLHNLMFFDAFENGKHIIPGIGSISSYSKLSTDRTATMDMPSGVKKGETYQTKSKHIFKFDQNSKATQKLAEIAANEGWAPEDFEGTEEA